MRRFLACKKRKCMIKLNIFSHGRVRKMKRIISLMLLSAVIILNMLPGSEAALPGSAATTPRTETFFQIATAFLPPPAQAWHDHADILSSGFKIFYHRIKNASMVSFCSPRCFCSKSIFLRHYLRYRPV